MFASGSLGILLLPLILPLLLFTIILGMVFLSLGGVALHKARPASMSVSLAGIVVNDARWGWAKAKLEYGSWQGRELLLLSSASRTPAAFRLKELQCYGGSIFLDWVEWFHNSSGTK